MAPLICASDKPVSFRNCTTASDWLEDFIAPSLVEAETTDNAWSGEKPKEVTRCSAVKSKSFRGWDLVERGKQRRGVRSAR